MKDLEKFRKLVDDVGSVLFYADLTNLKAWDTICKYLKEGGEFVIYCSPSVLVTIHEMLAKMNAYCEGDTNYGVWRHEPLGAMAFMSEGAFQRGSFQFYLISKPIEGAVIIPHDDKENPEARSINLKQFS